MLISIDCFSWIYIGEIDITLLLAPSSLLINITPNQDDSISTWRCSTSKYVTYPDAKPSCFHLLCLEIPSGF